MVVKRNKHRTCWGPCRFSGFGEPFLGAFILSICLPRINSSFLSRLRRMISTSVNVKRGELEQPDESHNKQPYPTQTISIT